MGDFSSLLSRENSMNMSSSTLSSTLTSNLSNFVPIANTNTSNNSHTAGNPRNDTGSAGAGATNGLTFRIPSMMGSSPLTSSEQPVIVQWDGMTLDQAVASNPNPKCIVTLLKDEIRHSNLMKELNYQHPSLAKKLKAAASLE